MEDSHATPFLRLLPFDRLRALSRFDKLKAQSTSRGKRSASKRRIFAAIPPPFFFAFSCACQIFGARSKETRAAKFDF
jgi:hypothetical protein